MRILHTGDIGVMDSEGYLKITDHLKDVIKIGGEWLSSLELEDLILKHPAVAEAAVVGTPDVKWGERPLALVVIKAGEELEEQTLRIWLQQFVEQGVISKWGEKPTSTFEVLKTEFIDVIPDESDLRC